MNALCLLVKLTLPKVLGLLIMSVLASAASHLL